MILGRLRALSSINPCLPSPTNWGIYWVQTTPSHRVKGCSDMARNLVLDSQSLVMDHHRSRTLSRWSASRGFLKRLQKLITDWWNDSQIRLIPLHTLIANAWRTLMLYQKGRFSLFLFMQRIKSRKRFITPLINMDVHSRSPLTSLFMHHNKAM